MLAAIRARVAGRDTVVYAVGVSLGGSALLNWLGRAGRDARAHRCSAAAAVSAPLDLMAAGIAIGQGLNRIYTHDFLRDAEAQGARDGARAFPACSMRERVRARANDAGFDDAVTAPLHGFAGADDYWTRASSKPWLAGDRACRRSCSTRATIRSSRRRRCRPRRSQRRRRCWSSPRRRPRRVS